MSVYNIHEARSQLSKLIDAIQQSEQVIIAKAGKPVAVLAALHAATRKRVRGVLKGQTGVASGSVRST